jgi:hypothetical protein
MNPKTMPNIARLFGQIASLRSQRVCMKGWGRLVPRFFRQFANKLGTSRPHPLPKRLHAYALLRSSGRVFKLRLD